MNKEKVLKLYKDFSDGKFVSPNQKKTYESGMTKLKDLCSKNGLYMTAQKHLISEVVFDKLMHPRLISDIYEGIIYTVFRAEKEKNLAMLEKYQEIAKAVGCINYFQSINKQKVSNEDIYVITSKTYKTFQDMELPDISFEDVIFPNDLPALFLFEEFNTVAYLNYYLTPIDNYLELYVSIFNHNLKFRFEGSTILLYSKNIPENVKIEGSTKVKDFTERSIKFSDDVDIELISKYSYFFFNLLTFLSHKETLKYRSEELNRDREIIESNISKNINVKKNKQILDNLPSYRFIDMEITLDNYIKEYYQKNPVKLEGNKKPHWRNKHWQHYWIGKKDGSEERRKIPKFIPTIWVGSPELMTEQTTFKVI